MSATRLPAGFHSLTPQLAVDGADRAIDYYKQAFGAEQVRRHEGPGGKVAHALLRIGDSLLMVTDAFPEWGSHAPYENMSPCTLHLYVEDADETFARAVAAGAKVTMPVQDTFWGDRHGELLDPFGHRWAVATCVDEMTPQQLERAAEEAMRRMRAGDD
jgi:PhnB protein